MTEPIKKGIPNVGKHKTDKDVEVDTGYNVRAQQPYPPEDSTPEEKTSPDYKFQLLHSEEAGHYRIRAWTDEVGDTPEGYKELSRYDTHTDIVDETEHLPDEKERFIVFENTDTGDVMFEKESSFSDDWSDEGRFDQITIFETEEEAAKYVDKRQKEMND